MSFSSGTYSLYATGNPVVTNTTISSTWANNTLNDIATALSTCMLKDGTQTATASVGFAFGIDVTTAATTSSTTFAVFNTTATTINAFGAASVALNIGHASAAAAFPGGISIPTGKSVTGAGTASITGFAEINSVAWTDYSSSSTVVGWAATPTVDIRYKKVGKLVFVAFSINGTSDATTVSFTLPAVSSNTSVAGWQGACGNTQNNGSDLTTASRWSLPKNSSTVTITRDMASAGWTASGAKYVSGTLWYEAA